jgi:DNA-binding NtrC family response regulator
MNAVCPFQDRGVENILLVDDDAELKQIMSQVLARLGYSVTSYTSSIEAFAEFRANPAKFDLIFTDFDTPKMSGDQLVQKIMAIRPSMPAIINTGNSKSITADLARSLGIRGVLEKPAPLSKLATMIREALDEAEAANKSAFILDAELRG